MVELVIQELCELAEDAPRQALTFVLAKPNGNATVELTSSRPQVLATLYKLVCMKRNLIESGEQPKQ
ncbi:MAG: hypothetical protein COB65_12325 [Thalassobium sp.]|nr:MAG: hypothetical protein COB65_12325 [Thalassobium sp.]